MAKSMASKRVVEIEYLDTLADGLAGLVDDVQVAPVVPDRRRQAPAVDFGGDLFRCGQVKRKRLFYKYREIAR